MTKLSQTLARAPAQPLLCRTCATHLRAGLQNNPRPRRHFTTTIRNSETHQSNQAQPLSGYYADLLASPLPSNAPIPSQKEKTQERAKIIFGSRLAGSGYEGSSRTPDSTWRTINGVPIPPRPAEPDNCCMSGCVHCVWDDYRDEIEDWALRLRSAQAKATAAGKGKHITRGKVPATGKRKEVESASKSMDDDGGGSETNWEFGPSDAAQEAEDLFGGIPVGIREFMKTEKRLRAMHRRDKAQAL